MNKKELKERWNSPLSGEQLNESPFGFFEGMSDFRGVELARPLREFKLEKANFSGAFLKVGQFTHADFKDCILDEANFNGTVYGGGFETCQFKKSKLNMDFCDVLFDRCSFLESNFRKSTTNNRVVFKDSTFFNCDLSKVHFMNTEFRNCIFKNCKSGSWASFAFSKFIGCDLSEMDFEDAIMDDVVIE